MQDWIEYAIQAGLVMLGAILAVIGKMFKDKWNQINRSTTSEAVNEVEIDGLQEQIKDLKQEILRHIAEEEIKWDQIQQQIIEIYKLLIKSKH